MTDLKKAAQQALEALKDCVKALDALHAPGDSIYTRASDLADRAEIALRAALEQEEPIRPTVQEMQNAAANLKLMKEMFGGSTALAQPLPDPVDEYRKGFIDGQIDMRDRPEEQEPVAWRTFDGEGGYDYRTYDGNENYCNEWDKRNPNHKGWVEPLFINPPRRETEQEPVAMVENGTLVRSNLPSGYTGPLYTHPPRREWQSLSEDELTALGVIHSRYQEESLETGGWFDFALAVEAALKEKNNG